MRTKQRAKVRGVQNEAMGEAFRELRKSSAAQPHRNRSKYNRNDFRKVAQRGF